MSGRLKRTTIGLLLTALGGFVLATVVTAPAAGSLPVSVPTMTVPSVPKPPIPLPLPVPSVATPPIPAPSLPAPASSSGSGGSGGSASGSSAGLGTALSSPSGPAIDGLANGPASAGASSPSGQAATGAGGSTAAGARQGSARKRAFSRRYLHRLLTRFRGCLIVIPSRYARVLTLRTGWGIGRSYSRQAVARRLHLNLAREAQIENRAVAALGSAGRYGSCSRARQANRSALFLAPAEQSLLSEPFPRAFVNRSSPRAKPAAHATARHHRHSVSGAATGGIGGTIPNLTHPGTASSFPWLFVALGLVVATALASPLARRRLMRPRLAGAGAMRRSPAPAAGAAALGAGVAAAGGAIARHDEPAHDDLSAAAATSLGARLEREGDVEAALIAYRRADAQGDAAGATNLGALLEQRGDGEGAMAAYRRADDRGDANGSFNLGCLLAERGEVSGAIEALRRADQRGDAAGASNLGVLLEQQGDLDGALAAYRRADERGDANGSFNLGLLLAGRGEVAEAEEAYRRAAEQGDQDVVERARSALAELHDSGGL